MDTEFQLIDKLKVLVIIVLLKLLLLIQLRYLDFELLNLRGALDLNFGQIYFHLLLLVFEVVNFIIFLLDFLLEFYLLLLKLVVSARDVLRVLFKEHLLLFQILGPLVI